MRCHTDSSTSRFPHYEEAVARVQELGDEALTGPFDVPAGRISVEHDPQEAVFALFEGQTDD